MNIAFFVSGLNSGGLENYLLRFLQYKHISFSNIYVYCKSGKGGQLEKQFLELSNVQIIKQHIGYFDIKALKQLEQTIEQNEIDAVCDFTGNFAGLILRTARKAGVKKRISFYRGATDHFKRDPLRRLYNKWVKHLTFKNATDILSNSKAAFNYFYPNNWKTDNRFEVIYNGIDADLFLYTNENLRSELSIPENAYVIGHVGRFDVSKNHSTMIKVALELCLNDPNVFFIFCGNGVIEELGNEVKINSLEHQIKLLGFRRDVIRVLNSLDCFYFPSITEGQPNALIESMIVGLPFVASNIPSIIETVREKDIEQLIPPCDVYKAIDKIKHIQRSSNSEDSKILSAWAIEKYNAEKLFNYFLKVIMK